MDVEAVLMIANVVQPLYQAVFSSDSSTSSEEDEENDDMMMWLGLIARYNEPVVRIQNYIEYYVPQFSYERFQAHFRVTIEAFVTLENRIGPLIAIHNDGAGRQPISARKQLLATIWLLATPESYRSVADRFGIAESTLWQSVQRVTNALIGIAPQIISWPTPAQREVISAAFEQVAGLPTVIGAVDGAFVEIKAPAVDKEVYVTRKFFYAYTVQRISDSNLKFIDIYTGWPGSVSDTRIFRNSPIYEDVMAHRAEFFDEEQYIIGDKAYPVLDWCIAPYINRGNLTVHQARFNTAHARQRATIERAWALLFGRFRRLKYLDMTREDLIPSTILACCVLHNICLDHQDLEIAQFENEGHIFRIDRDHDQEIEQVVLNPDAAAIRGLQRRNELCRLIHARHAALQQA